MDGSEVGEGRSGEEGVAFAGGGGHLVVKDGAADEGQGQKQRCGGEGQEYAAMLPMEPMTGAERGGCGAGVEEAVADVDRPGTEGEDGGNPEG